VLQAGWSLPRQWVVGAQPPRLATSLGWGRGGGGGGASGAAAVVARFSCPGLACAVRRCPVSWRSVSCLSSRAEVVCLRSRSVIIYDVALPKMIAGIPHYRVSAAGHQSRSPIRGSEPSVFVLLLVLRLYLASAFT